MRLAGSSSSLGKLPLVQEELDSDDEPILSSAEKAAATAVALHRAAKGSYRSSLIMDELSPTSATTSSVAAPTSSVSSAATTRSVSTMQQLLTINVVENDLQVPQVQAFIDFSALPVVHERSTGNASGPVKECPGPCLLEYCLIEPDAPD